jgi:hypothetical protein
MMKNIAKLKPQAVPRPGENSTTDGAVLAQLAALQRMSVNELKAKWQELFASAAPNNSRSFLEVRIAARIQELTYGGLSRETRRALEVLADEIEGKIDRKRMANDSRNPSPGTKLVREWDGAEHVVTVHADGYEWNGRKFRSLSAIAKDITGTSWNGFRFFGLLGKSRSGK